MPTSEAARYAAALGSALDLVERSTEVLRATGTDLPRLVRLTTTGSVASLWLVPRLAAFRAGNPGVEVWVSESRELVPLGRPGGPELALRLGRGPWAGVRAEPLMTDEAVVVSAPSVAARLRTPEDLARVTLLQTRIPACPGSCGWRPPAWGDRRGGTAVRGSRTVGSCCRPPGRGRGPRSPGGGSRPRSSGPVRWSSRFPTRVPLGPSYWLVLPRRGTPLSPGARALATWLRETAREETSAD